MFILVYVVNIIPNHYCPKRGLRTLTVTNIHSALQRYEKVLIYANKMRGKCKYLVILHYFPPLLLAINVCLLYTK